MSYLFISKIITKKDPKRKEKVLTLKIHSMIAYCSLKDDPLTQQVACELFDSDVMFLNLKEIEENEPIGENKPLCYCLSDITK